MKLAKICYLLFIFLLVGCSTVPVKIDYNPSADFTNFTTFTVGKVTDQDDLLSKNPLIRDRVNASIVKKMEAQGYLYDNDAPDILVYPRVSIKDKISAIGLSSAYPGFWEFGPYGSGDWIDVREYTEGCLIIDIVSAKDELLAWRGAGKFTVTERELTPQESQHHIDEIVGAILDRYPPDESITKN